MNYAITLHILLELCLKQEKSILELGKKKNNIYYENNSKTFLFFMFIHIALMAFFFLLENKTKILLMKIIL